jgi:hypothetical protein
MVAVDDEVGKTGAVACAKEPGGCCDIETSVLLTAFDRRPLCLWQSDRTAIPSYHPRPKQSIESSRVPRHLPDPGVADHRAGFVPSADGRP